MRIADRLLLSNFFLVLPRTAYQQLNPKKRIFLTVGDVLFKDDEVSGCSEKESMSHHFSHILQSILPLPNEPYHLVCVPTSHEPGLVVSDSWDPPHHFDEKNKELAVHA